MPVITYRDALNQALREEMQRDERVFLIGQDIGVGGGVFERRLDFGPGYRLYFGRDGETLIILLGGGSKARQQRDIAPAQAYWVDYKIRKRGMA